MRLLIPRKMCPLATSYSAFKHNLTRGSNSSLHFILGESDELTMFPFTPKCHSASVNILLFIQFTFHITLSFTYFLLFKACVIYFFFLFLIRAFFLNASIIMHHQYLNSNIKSTGDYLSQNCSQRISGDGKLPGNTNTQPINNQHDKLLNNRS